MKKFFTTIMVALLGATTLMAQEEDTSFSFYRNGELVPNGSTVIITEFTAEDLGGLALVEMNSGITVRNNNEGKGNAIFSATGISNYESIQVCPGGNCIPWRADGTIVSAAVEIESEGEIDPQCHISGIFPSPFSYIGSITLTAADYFDDEDATTITIIFDTTGSSSIKGVKSDKNKCEVFNLCGKKIADTTVGLSKGIYIVKQNGTSRKMVIK